MEMMRHLWEYVEKAPVIHVSNTHTHTHTASGHSLCRRSTSQACPRDINQSRQWHHNTPNPANSHVEARFKSARTRHTSVPPQHFQTRHSPCRPSWSQAPASDTHQWHHMTHDSTSTLFPHVDARTHQQARQAQNQRCAFVSMSYVCASARV